MSDTLGALLGATVVAVAGLIGVIFKARSDAKGAKESATDADFRTLIEGFKSSAEQARIEAERTRAEMSALREEHARQMREMREEIDKQVNGVRRDLAAALIHIRDLRDVIGPGAPALPEELRLYWPI